MVGKFFGCLQNYLLVCSIGELDDESRNFRNTYNLPPLCKSTKRAKMNRNPPVKFNELRMNQIEIEKS